MIAALAGTSPGHWPRQGTRAERGGEEPAKRNCRPQINGEHGWKEQEIREANLHIAYGVAQALQ